MQVTFGECVFRPDEIYAQDLNSVLDTMRYSEKLEWLIEDIRAAKDKKERNKLKADLPYFIGGVVKDKRHVDNFVSSKMVILDVDDLDEGMKNILKCQIKNHHKTHFLFESPSGKGLKVGILLDKVITDAKLFTAIYRKVKQEFEEYFMVECDKTVDPVRACYLTFDEDLYHNPNSTEHTTIVELPKKISTVPTYKFVSNSDPDINEMLGIARECSVPDYQDWISVGMALKSELGGQGLDIFKALSLKKGFNDSEIDVERKWETFPNRSDLGLGTFYHFCKK